MQFRKGLEQGWGILKGSDVNKVLFGKGRFFISGPTLDISRVVIPFCSPSENTFCLGGRWGGGGVTDKYIEDMVERHSTYHKFFVWLV